MKISFLFVAILLNGAICSSYPTIAPSESPLELLHRYSFQEPENSNIIHDTANVLLWNGSQKHGSVIGSVSFNGESVTFSGVGYISLPSDILESSSSVTIEAWFTGSSSNTNWNRIFQFGATAGNSDSIALVRNYDTGNILLESWLPTTKRQLATSNVNFNALSNAHIVVILDPVQSSTMQIYVDSTFKGNVSLSATDRLPSNTGNNFVGAGIQSQEKVSHGTLDELRIWRGILNSEKILSHYEIGPDDIPFPTEVPTEAPTEIPSEIPSQVPTEVPTEVPTLAFFCPVGFYLTATDVKYDAGVPTAQKESSRSCLPCPSGKFSPEGSNECFDCSSGYYSNEQSSVCMPCPAGFYAMKGASECKECKAGTVSNTTAASCTTCRSGYYSSPGSSECIGCEAGEYAKQGASECHMCPAGTISNATATTCTACPEGMYSYPGTSKCLGCSNSN